MNKVVSYIRVSSKEQKDQGFSPDAQKRLLWQFARNNNMDIVMEFEDTETAKKAGRTNFTKMLQYVEKHNIKFILVEKTDRLYRNFKDYVAVDELVLNSDVTVYLVKENDLIGKTSSSQQKFIHGIKVLQAKNFIDNLREEVLKGQAEKLQRGEYPGKAPLGYLNYRNPESKKSTIMIDHKNASLIRLIFKDYSSGNYSLMSLIQKIKNENLDLNVPKNYKIEKSNISHLLENPFYYGYFRWKNQLYKGSHEPLITYDLWSQVQEIKNGKCLNRAVKHNVKPFIFKGILHCGECKRTITAEIKKKRYVYYRCTKYGTKCSQKSIREEKIEEEFIALLKRLELSEIGYEYVLEGLKQSLKDKQQLEDVIVHDLERERKKVKNRLSQLYEDKLDNKISESFYNQKATEYENKIMDLDHKIVSYDQAEINYYEIGKKILELAKNAEFFYKEANPIKKQQLAKFLLSNSTLMDGKPMFTIQKPFNMVLERSGCSDWYPKGFIYRTF